MMLPQKIIFLMAQQKSPNARRANNSEQGVLKYAAVTNDAVQRGSWRLFATPSPMRQLIIVLCLLFGLPLSAAAAMSGEEVLAQVDRNLQPDNLEMYRKIINIEPNGKKKEYVFWYLKKDKDKIVTLFLSPASEEGRATLRLGENMWLYIPNVGKPIRITNLQSVVGGVFNNADIMRLDYGEEYTVTSMGEEGESYVLDLKAKTVAVAYDRLRMLVRKDSIMPERIECYAATGMLIKTLYFKEPKDIGDGVIRPSVTETDSPLYKDYKSIMISDKLKRRDLPDEVFTLNYLQRVRELR
jgi:outer membrane lipoprotein-sorting protein